MNSEQKEALKIVLKYLWHDEEIDFEANPQDNYIFNSLVVLQAMLDNMQN